MLQTLLGGLALGFVASPTCPSNAEGIRLGTRHGFWPALMVGLGAVAGDAAVLAAMLLGLLPLIQAEPLLQAPLWFVGSAVLLYVARGTFVEARTPVPAPAPAEFTAAGRPNPVRGQPPGHARAFWIGFAITAFNPFTGLWWLGLLGPLAPAGRQATLTLSLAVLAGALAWFILVAVLLHMARPWLSGRPRQWLLAGSGLAVLGFGLYFLWQGVAALLGRGTGV